MAEFNEEFNATTLAKALEEPVLVLGTLKYRGRVLSIEEWLPFYERQVALNQERDTAATRAEKARAVRDALELWVDFLYAVFPRRGQFSWFAPDPVRQLRKTPGPALREAYYHFFYLQARALGWELVSPAADGESSLASTPPVEAPAGA